MLPRSATGSGRALLVKIHPHDLLIQELFASSGDENLTLLEHILRCSAGQRRTRELLHARPDPVVQKVVPLDWRIPTPAAYGGGLERGSPLARNLQAACDWERSGAVTLPAG